MPDENDLNQIINKMDNISTSFNKIAENFLLELTKMKKIFPYSKKKLFVPNKFFNNFLKPQLEKKEKMTKKEMFRICEQRRKYNSYNTLNSYLYKLEKNEYIQSVIIRNEKHYMLVQKER